MSSPTGLTVAPAGQPGLSKLFKAAFVQSRNPMTLVDSHRRHLEVNGPYLRLIGCRRAEVIGRPIYRWVLHGPIATPAEWDALLASGQFAGEGRLRRDDGETVAVQWAATVEIVTGHRLVLFVVLGALRAGGGSRRPGDSGVKRRPLSRREREIVRLVSMGSTGPEIAQELGIAHETVRTHVRNAMDKLDARSRAHLVAKALGGGHALEP